MTHAWVGVSGWDYRHWQGRFYPAHPSLPSDERLAFLSQRVGGVEINTTFYGLRKPADFLRWRSGVPDGFVFAVKGSRYITHMKRLLDARQALANFFASGPLALGGDLGPFLWQLPPQMRWDAERVSAFLDLLPRDTTALRELAADHDPAVVTEPFLAAPEHAIPVRHAIEARNPGFGADEAAQVLREHGVAMVMADSAGRWPTLDLDTADFRYLRLHGTGPRRYSGSYQDRWDPWLGTVRAAAEAGKDSYVFFDNDARAQAPRDAMALIDLLGPDLTGS